MHEHDLQLQKEKRENQKTFTKQVLDGQVQEKKVKQKELRSLKERNDQMVIKQVEEFRKQQD